MSFLDHFPGSALDSSRWTKLENGTGTVTVADGRVTCAGVSAGDAAAFYYNTKISKTKSQVWLFCFRQVNTTATPFLKFVIKSTAPVVESSGVALLGQIWIGDDGSNRQMYFDKWNTAGTRNQWDDSTKAWSATSNVVAMGPVVLDDYHVVGFEIDGVGQRIRYIGAAKSSGSSYSDDIGLQVWPLTEWLNFSDLRNGGDDMWLLFGWHTNFGGNWPNGSYDVEWVRHADGPKLDAWDNQKDHAGDYNIKHVWSYDRKIFLPETRDGVAIAAGSGWESAQTKHPSVVRDDADGTYYMAYAAMGSVHQIGIASSPTGLDGSWTKYGSNPIIAATASNTDDEWVSAPHLIKDNTDPDPAKRWKIYYTGTNLAAGNTRKIRLATASTPLGTWTKQGDMLLPGGSGAFDEKGPTGPRVFLNDGVWEMWYSGRNGAATQWNIGRATATDSNGPFTQDGAGIRIAGYRDEVQALSANLAGRTLSLTSTTGFEVDQLIVVDQDSDGTNFNISRIRKVTTDTSLELYHALQGFTTANSAEVRGFLAGNVTIETVDFAEGEWRFYCSVFGIYNTHGTFLANLEMMVVLTSSTLLGAKTVSWIDSPSVDLGQWNNKAAAENITFLRQPINGPQPFLKIEFRPAP